MTEENGSREIKTASGRTFRLTGEAAHERNPNADPGLQAFRRDMEARQAGRQAEKEGEVVRLEQLREAEFYDALAERYQDRLRLYQLKGVPESVFVETIWPELARQYTLEGEDEVDRERRERSTSAY